MPIYAYRCTECGAERDQFNRIAERHTNAPTCCDRGMDVKLCANLGHVQESFAAECPVTGQIITTHRQRRRVMDEHGLVDQRELGGARKSYEKAKKEFERNEELGKLLKQPDLSDRVLDKYRPALPTTV